MPAYITGSTTAYVTVELESYPCVGHLQDAQEDVRAVSAEALLPVVGALGSQGRQTGDVLRVLWDALLEVDDLSPSTGRHAPFPVGCTPGGVVLLDGKSIARWTGGSALFSPCLPGGSAVVSLCARLLQAASCSCCCSCKAAQAEGWQGAPSWDRCCSACGPSSGTPSRACAWQLPGSLLPLSPQPASQD